MTTELSHAKGLWKRYDESVIKYPNDSFPTLSSGMYRNFMDEHASTIQRWKDFLDIVDKTIEKEIGDLVIRSKKKGMIAVKLADLNSCLDFYKKVGVIK